MQIGQRVGPYCFPICLRYLLGAYATFRCFSINELTSFVFTQELVSKDKAVETNCGHLFDQQCLAALRAPRSCPICRYQKRLLLNDTQTMLNISPNRLPVAEHL
jgi:hypothetical protein